MSWYTVGVVVSLFCLVGISSATSHRKTIGISDGSAVVGHLFNFSIAQDALKQGEHRHYKLSEAGENGLPSWLHFDNVTLSLAGVPLLQDVGRIYLSAEVYTQDKDDKPIVEKDVFSIEVVEKGVPVCSSNDGEMLLSLVINTPTPDKMKPLQRVHLLASAADFLRIDVQRLELSEIKEQQTALDENALKAGPGDAQQRNAQASKILFTADCSGRTANDEHLTSLVEKSASDGTLGDALGYSIVGWQITETSITRQKRYVTPYRGTPVLELHATIFPKVTERFFERTTEPTPESRIVPTMVSPDFSRHTYPHQHRHHHGQEPPLRRGHFPGVTDATATPTWKYHGMSTLHGFAGTPMPTPILYPDRPTAIYPSRVVIEHPTLRILSTGDLPVDIVSRWYEVTTYHETVDIGQTRTRFTVEPTKVFPQSTNFKPTLNNRMRKLSLVCGKAWSYSIPKDTFLDLEDGNTRALKLMFTTSERTSIPASSWIQFDPENQLLYALPLLENIGKHEYVLEAMDKEGSSTFDRVELHVWPHPQFDTFSHAFSMTVRYNKWQYPVGIDWQTEILNRLSIFFGDSDNSRLVVLSVTLEPSRITWANDSLPIDTCSLDEIKGTYEAIAAPDQHPSREMKKIMSPEFRIQEITVRYSGACEGMVTSAMPPPNFSPKVLHPIRRVNVTVGDVLKLIIPEDTFYDFEDGNTRHLRLALLAANNLALPKSHWVQFDTRHQELYGVASKEDVGRQQYRLSAMDADGQAAIDTFEIHVQRLSHRYTPPVEFSIYIMHDFDEFVADTSKKTLVASKIAELYGDSSPLNILVTSTRRGSVIYSWSNKTLPNDYCPKREIDRLFSYLVNHDGTLTLGLVEVMEPEFKISRASIVLVGVCLTGIPPTFVSFTTTPETGSHLPDQTDATVKSISTTTDMYVTTVLPAAIVTAVLLVAVIVVVYIFYCRRQTPDKASELDVDKEFVGGGVPVVFAGETEESKPDPGKAPAILPNEKPPLTTDYLLNPLRRGAAAVRDSMAAASHMHQQPPQQHFTHQQSLHMQQETSPQSRERRFARHERKDTTQLYQPPPPFTHGRESKSTRPKVAPAYSRHPTYVPP